VVRRSERGRRPRPLRRADVDEVVEQLEVACVLGEQGDAVHSGGCGDGEIERAPAGLSSTPARSSSSDRAESAGAYRRWTSRSALVRSVMIPTLLVDR
jgi:hypothetical protein